MVELKVRKIGNSLGVVLPKEVITRLNTGDGEPLYLVEAPDGGYRLVHVAGRSAPVSTALTRRAVCRSWST